jgi:hypothetical protein
VGKHETAGYEGFVFFFGKDVDPDHAIDPDHTAQRQQLVSTPQVL